MTEYLIKPQWRAALNEYANTLNYPWLRKDGDPHFIHVTRNKLWNLMRGGAKGAAIYLATTHKVTTASITKTLVDALAGEMNDGNADKLVTVGVVPVIWYWGNPVRGAYYILFGPAVEATDHEQTIPQIERAFLANAGNFPAEAINRAREDVVLAAKLADIFGEPFIQALAA